MIKLKFKYYDEHEKISAQYNTDADSITIVECIEKMCKFLIAIGYSEELINKYINFDGYEIYERDEE